MAFHLLRSYNRRGVVGLLALMSLFSLYSLHIATHSTLRDARLNLWRPVPMQFLEKIYVISLPGRQSRRNEMERLRRALGLTWEYHDAITRHGPQIKGIMDIVRSIRFEKNNTPTRNSTFAWPAEIEELASSTERLEIFQGDFSNISLETRDSQTVNHPMTCAANDNDIKEYSPNLPEHFLLTDARVACWHSHLMAIHKVANTVSDGTGATLILEDDVDMESDIDERLTDLWSNLPSDWDIVFLGYCWSDEGHGKPLGQPSSSFQLHESNHPKCTHAYVLSRIGARRLLLHLGYPLFAYSRALDVAIAWLIQNKRLKAFSVVPSIVVQRKLLPSDLEQGVGSKWRDTLRQGVLDSLDQQAGNMTA